MKSTRQNYTMYQLLGTEVNPFTDADGWTAHWWTFEEALDQVVDSESEGIEGTITSGASSGTDDSGRTTAMIANLWRTGGEDYHGGTDPEDLQIDEDDGSVFLTGAEYHGGSERLFARMAQSDDAQIALRAFFPYLPTSDGSHSVQSYIDGQNYITKMTNTGIYYAPPPLTTQGFLNVDKYFALSSKNSYFKMSNTYATDNATRSGGRGGGSMTPINPCPGCTTIGRANNGWHEMTKFFKGTGAETAGGVYNPWAVENPFSDAPSPQRYFQGANTGQWNDLWELETQAAFSALVAAGVWDSATYDTMIDYLEISENTYGSAAFTSFFIYENWYGIMTTYSPAGNSEGSYTWQASDDMFSLSFYHPRAIAKTLSYTTNIISSGGYPDSIHDNTTWIAPVISGGNSTTYEWINAEITSLRTNQSQVPMIPYVLHADHAWSLSVKEALGSFTPTGAIPAASQVVYHNNKTDTESPGEFIAGDKMRRYQTRNDYNGTYKRSMGSYTKAKGFVANKAWILQNALTVWNGKLENKINQQLTRNLDIDLMHPVGDSLDSTPYTSSALTPMTTTSSDSSY